MPPNRLPSTLPKLNFYIDSCLFETVNIRESSQLNLNEKKLHKIPRYARKKKTIYQKHILPHSQHESSFEADVCGDQALRISFQPWPGPKVQVHHFGSQLCRLSLRGQIFSNFAETRLLNEK